MAVVSTEVNGKSAADNCLTEWDCDTTSAASALRKNGAKRQLVVQDGDKEGLVDGVLVY